MNEEEKAIEFLKNKTTNYSLSGEELHYYLILYYLIINLQKENNQLKEQLEKEKEVQSKAIGHVNACGGELTKDECKYLLQILDIYKGE